MTENTILPNETSTKLTLPKQMTGKKVLFWFLGFFGVIMSVNIFMLTLAFSTHPGLVTENPYKDAKSYNKGRLAAIDQQNSGWKISTVHIPKTIISDHFDTKVTYPKDALPPKSVKVTFMRPALVGHDLTFDLFHRGDYIFTAPIDLKMDGVWNILVTVETVKGKKYFSKSRLVIEHAPQ